MFHVKLIPNVSSMQWLPEGVDFVLKLSTSPSSNLQVWNRDACLLQGHLFVCVKVSRDARVLRELTANARFSSRTSAWYIGDGSMLVGTSMRHYIVTERLGITLRQFVHRMGANLFPAVPLHVAANIGHRVLVCASLAVRCDYLLPIFQRSLRGLHVAGFVHGDVKPAKSTRVLHAYARMHAGICYFSSDDDACLYMNRTTSFTGQMGKVGNGARPWET